LAVPPSAKYPLHESKGTAQEQKGRKQAKRRSTGKDRGGERRSGGSTSRDGKRQPGANLREAAGRPCGERLVASDGRMASSDGRMTCGNGRRAGGGSKGGGARGIERIRAHKSAWDLETIEPHLSTRNCIPFFGDLLLKRRTAISISSASSYWAQPGCRIHEHRAREKAAGHIARAPT